MPLRIKPLPSIFPAGVVFGLASLLLASPAAAEPYLGFEGSQYLLTLKSSDSALYPQSAGGWGLHIGDRFGNLAAELGVSTSIEAGSANNDNLHLTRATLDGLFYLPLLGGLNLLVTGGGAETNYGVSTYSINSYQVGTVFKHANGDVPVLHGSEFDWRGGAGFSFGFDEFEIRVLARYQPLSLAGQAENALAFDVAGNWYF